MSEPKQIKVRALTARQVIEKKRDIYQFDGKYLESFGCPERGATILIFGKSGNGKTRLALDLCKYYAQFGRLEYNSYEEGDKQSFAKALHETGMGDVPNFKLLPGMDKDSFFARLAGRRSADIAVFDSIQYSQISYLEHKHHKTRLKRKTFIYISHGNGNNPDGKTADKIRYDADIKIHVIGYVANVKSRYGGCKPFLIWEEGAKKYWGKNYSRVIAGKYWPGDKK